MKRTSFKSATPATPCPVCDGDHKCSLGADGSIQCGRVAEGLRPGARHMQRCVNRLRASLIEEVPVLVDVGSKGKRTVKGLRRKRED